MCSSTPNVSETDRTLIIGSTGFIGRFVAETSLDYGRPTYLLVRSGPTCPSKASTIKSLQERGAIVIHVITHQRHPLFIVFESESVIWAAFILFMHIHLLIHYFY